MIPRRMEQAIRGRLREYPAVAVLGPRQCGKTTLAKSLGGCYFDLEQDEDRLRLDIEWSQRTADRQLLILDEAQVWPEVFARLRGTIDEDRDREGRFLLLGSVSPVLMTQVSESLAGRLSVVELSPLSWNEIAAETTLEPLWFYGGYPEGGVLSPRRYPRWQLDYLTLLAQRDLPAWGLPAKPKMTERLLRMLAVDHGQVWNASRVGKSLGVSYHTVNGYLDYLEGAFLIRRLASFHENIGKRLSKRPKIYWRDTGLLHALLGVPSAALLLNQPWVGASWEGFVLEQILAVLTQCDRSFEAYYVRTSDEYEIDLLLDFGVERWAIEVKLTANPSREDLRKLVRVAALVSADRCFLVSQVQRVVTGEREVSCNLPWLLERIQSDASFKV